MCSRGSWGPRETRLTEEQISDTCYQAGLSHQGHKNWVPGDLPFFSAYQRAWDRWHFPEDIPQEWFLRSYLCKYWFRLAKGWILRHLSPLLTAGAMPVWMLICQECSCHYPSSWTESALSRYRKATVPLDMPMQGERQLDLCADVLHPAHEHNGTF